MSPWTVSPDLPARLALAAFPVSPASGSPCPPHAAADGLVRGLTCGLYDDARAHPWDAAVRLREGLRRHGRSLGSKGRRMAASALYGLVRHERILGLLVEAAGGRAGDTSDRYLGWLVWAEGLEPAVAARNRDMDFTVFARARDMVAASARDMEPALALALGGSLPLTVAEEWWQALGPDAVALLEAFSRRPALVVRANQARISREALADRLRAEGVESVPGLLSPQALRMEGHPNLDLLESSREGLLEVQDEGSQQVAALVEPRPGLQVLDLCAGAGGKALALAAAGAHVWALDARPAALRELEERARRARLPIRVGGQPPSGWAQVVLVDAPCSGSGVLGRHPETRWRLEPDQVRPLVRRQEALLREGAGRVAPGGRLVYATCSLLASENQEVVARLEGWEPVAWLGEAGVLWPQRFHTDGYFGVVLERRG